MPEYAYHAVDRQGRASDGTMFADDEKILERRLREIGYWLIDARVRHNKRARVRKKVPRRELIDFFNGITSLLIAGIPIAEAISAMAEETEHTSLKNILEDISVNVQSGNEVSESFRKYPGVFSDQVCNLVRAGEQGGNLVETFTDISNHLAWVDRIMADVKQASIYPMMIIAAVAGLIALMFIVVVPKFAEIFAELETDLPGLTRSVIGIGEFAQQYWWAIALGTAGLAVFVMNVRRINPSIALAIDRLKLNIPVFGKLQRLLVQSQFVHNLALMLRAGVPIVEALTLSQGLTNNLVMDRAIADAEAAVQRGDRVSSALRQHSVVSSLTLRMIVVGEDSGRLDTTLQQISDRYDEEIPRQIKRVFSVLEPMITMVLVAIVGLIAASIFLPMFALVSGLG
ncbi:MAG: type II secretion system F family protein [Pseudomonadota bacterium]